MGMIDTKNEKHSKMTILLPQQERKITITSQKSHNFFSVLQSPKIFEEKDLLRKITANLYLCITAPAKKCKSNNGSNLVNKVYLMMD